MTPRTPKHPKTGHNPTQPDGSLQLALTQLDNAICDLTNPRTAQTPHDPDHPSHTIPIPARYHALRAAIYAPRGGTGHAAPGSTLPFWIDAMKATMLIDQRVFHITRRMCQPNTTTVNRLRHLGDYPKYRPQDAGAITTLAAELESWARMIDDLFAVKPLYLPDPCPQCLRHWAYRWDDQGEHVRTPALSVHTDRGAVCANCHAVWAPDRLTWLGRLLGYSIEGVVA